MARADVIDIDHGWARIKQEMATLRRKGVKIGVQSDAGAEADGTAIVDVATYNEFGTENIPPRPAFRYMADNCWPQLNAVALKAAESIKAGQTADYALGMVGGWYQDQQKRVIRDGPWVPNAPMTIKMKGSDKPLIDTSRYVGSIRWAYQPL